MYDASTNGGLRGHGREFAEAWQRLRDEERLELAEDRALDLTRLSKIVDRFGESNALHRMTADLAPTL
jgi:hypothetical protein